MKFFHNPIVATLLYLLVPALCVGDYVTHHPGFMYIIGLMVVLGLLVVLFMIGVVILAKVSGELEPKDYSHIYGEMMGELKKNFTTFYILRAVILWVGVFSYLVYSCHFTLATIDFVGDLIMASIIALSYKTPSTDD